MNLTTLLILILIGIFGGLASGMIGVGGGIIMVPGMVVCLGLAQVEAQGTSVAAMLPPIGILAAMNYYRAEAINWKYAVVLAVAFIIGGYFGSKWTINFIDEKMLKKIFGGVMLVVAVKMMFFSK